MLTFTGERIVPEADNCEPLFALKMYQEHIARYLLACQTVTGQSALDVGCGIGYGAQLLARSGACRVTAFDISIESIEHARQFYPHPNVEYLVSSAEDFSFSEQFDVITCFELIEHLQNQHRAVQSIAAALKSNGLLFISTPRPLGKLRSAHHVRELSLLNLTNLLSCYFPNVEWFFQNNHFASLIAKSTPSSINAVYNLHPQFELGQADYFIGVASHSGLGTRSLHSQLVLNNEAYVKQLERDVEILHQTEEGFHKQIRELTIEAAEQEAINTRYLSETSSTTIAELQSRVDSLERTNHEQSEQLIILEAKNRELSESLLLADCDRRGRESQLTVLHAELRRARERNKEESADLISDLYNSREILRLREAELGHVKAQLSQREAEIAAQYRELSKSQACALVEKQRAADNELRLQALVSSRSWLLTDPLRRVATIVRGHANDPLQIGELDHVSVRKNGQHLEHSSPQETEYIREARADNTVDPKNGLQENEKKNAIESVVGDFQIPSRPRFDLLYIIGCHDGESKRYRVHNLASSIGALGYRVESWPQEKIQALIKEQFFARVVVLFRCAFDERIDEITRYCRENGITSIFDVDDLVFEPESTGYVRALQSFSEAERKQYDAGVVQYRRSLTACNRATATTNFLSRRIQAIGIPSDVIPNSLNRRQLEIANAILANPLKQRKEVRIGYFSGSNTHQTDFQACEAALLTVMQRHSQVRFILVGILDLGRQWDSLSDRIERHSFLPYEQMLGLLSTIDINLAPLELGNPYCESKSQLKIFEAGVVSIPTIATMVESYREAITHGKDGMLAGNIEDWTSALEELVQSPELRLRMGRLARERALTQFGPEVAVRKALEVYQLPPLQEHSDIGSDKRLKITWIIPGLEIGSGGHRNILRAAYFLEQFGHEIELYFTGINLSGEQLREDVHTHFYPLHGAMHSYAGSINQTDVLFATHWTTVEVAMKARDAAREIIYFVQDFEPAFAAVGTEYILAENTYRLGLYHITSGPWCEAVLRRDFGCEADHFMFPVDRRIYHPKARKKSNANVVFFARPEMPRRCFDLGVQALDSFHRLSPDVEIILFGSQHINESTLPFAATVKSLLPKIQDLAQLYADADLGIAFSTTNPSLVPYEMMACGLPVVDLGRPGNELNYGGRKDIAFLADPMPPKLGLQIHELLNDRGQLASRSKNGLEFVQSFPSEEEMARRIERLIIKRIGSRSVRARAAVRG